MPQRVQLRRSAGWRTPPHTIVVARPSRWGNPFRIGVDGDRAECVAMFRSALLGGVLAFSVTDVQRQLGGKDLACWCPLTEQCHADVLIDLASDAAHDHLAVGPGQDETRHA